MANWNDLFGSSTITVDAGSASLTGIGSSVTVTPTADQKVIIEMLYGVTGVTAYGSGWTLTFASRAPFTGMSLVGNSLVSGADQLVINPPNVSTENGGGLNKAKGNFGEELIITNVDNSASNIRVMWRVEEKS